MRRAAPLARTLALALALGVLAAACERPPKVEPLGEAPLAASAYPAVTVESAALVAGKVEVTYKLTDLASGAPITGSTGIALTPSWTLAWLGVEPVSGLRAWRSLLLLGSTTVASLPPAGPGTPAAQVMTSVRQPSGETSGSATAGPTVELGAGRFKYTFANGLPSDFWPPSGVNAGATLRVGVYLRGVTTGTATTATTFDFVPNGGAPESHELVRQENCVACHGLLKMHGGRISGVNLCVTCHSWLLADPDTVDPAAMAPATRATYPNPLELGRMVHRIHRGKKLPTLFKASSAATWPPDYMSSVPSSPWPASPFTGVPPLPFFPGRNGVAAVGTKFNIIGNSSTEYVFGRVASRAENFQPARTLAEGLGYPQDLRNCDACHVNAAQRDAIGTGGSPDVSISRRTCSGCHPDVFYGDPNDLAVITPDATHLAHTGGRQLDDTACKDCHVAQRAGGPKVYAPIAEIHRPPGGRTAFRSPYWSRWEVKILGVQDMTPGGLPKITLQVSDRVGAIAPTLGAPDPAYEPASATNLYPSPVPRGLSGFSIVLAGPTTDYLNGNVNLRASPPLTSATDANGVLTWTFTTAIPSTATGTWAVGVEGRRRPATAGALYSAALDAFAWPYTGEAVSEYASNPVKFVDVSTGTITTDSARARRSVVDQARCEKCHLELNLHGANRHDVAHCLLCHTPDMTDWDKRPRDTRTVADGGVLGSGVVLLNDPIDPLASLKRWGFATLDGIEERSIHFKTMVHRIHVGERVGAASLEGIRPFVIYAMSYTPSSPPNPYFFDDVRFPGELANCELCHLEGTWTLEAMPTDAKPTTANERPSIRHAATFNADGTVKTVAVAAHTSASDPKVLPITATCLSCHTSGAAVNHAAGKTSGGVEQCASCHGASGAESVRKWHAVP
jgi:OmcA/MtrC family decaheme c-type cytochrome